MRFIAVFILLKFIIFVLVVKMIEKQKKIESFRCVAWSVACRSWVSICVYMSFEWTAFFWVSECIYVSISNISSIASISLYFCLFVRCSNVVCYCTCFYYYITLYVIFYIFLIFFYILFSPFSFLFPCCCWCWFCLPNTRTESVTHESTIKTLLIYLFCLVFLFLPSFRTWTHYSFSICDVLLCMCIGIWCMFL